MTTLSEPRRRTSTTAHTMLAAVLEDVGKMPLKQVPKPAPKRDEALVRLMAVGICGTDNAAYTGDRKDWDQVPSSATSRRGLLSSSVKAPPTVSTSGASAMR